jgi:dimethylhistidine N-methyltransferase
MTTLDDLSRGNAVPRPRDDDEADLDIAGTTRPPAIAANDAVALAHDLPGSTGTAIDSTTEAFARDVLDGLARPAKAIPCLWLYDRRGSELFEDITTLDEYYPTRTETRLLAALAPELATRIGPGADLVELGSGSSTKTRLLLQAMPALARYLPVDISADFLHDAVAALRRDFPGLAVEPVVADFSAPFTLPALPLARGAAAAPRLGFFPGSTIGNFMPEAAVALLANFAHALGAGAWLLIGVDTTRDPARLVPAYDDARGVTAAFDLNLLARANRELGADFDLDAFRHEARFDAAHGRVEMHLVSTRAQEVAVRGRRFAFREGESIHTENAYKYDDDTFRALAARAGWQCERAWRDDAGSGFSVYLARTGA